MYINIVWILNDWSIRSNVFLNCGGFTTLPERVVGIGLLGIPASVISESCSAGNGFMITVNNIETLSDH